MTHPGRRKDGVITRHGGLGGDGDMHSAGDMGQAEVEGDVSDVVQVHGNHMGKNIYIDIYHPCTKRNPFRSIQLKIATAIYDTTYQGDTIARG